MTELYRAAGIKGKRTHEWRDTIGMDLLEDGATLEDVQMALAHKSRRTTERFYVRASRQRHRLANAAKRRLWAKDSFLKLISPEGGVEQPESTIPVRPTASNADGLPAD
jgi:integrase